MAINLNKPPFILLISVLAVIGLVVFGVRFFSPVVEDANRVAGVEEMIVRGNSLAPLLEDGQVVRALFGYYERNEIQRGDIVLYSYAGNEAPLIKIIKGVPGDKFNLQQTEGGWHILINGKVLTNSENQPYLLNQRAYNMLSLYERDYQGIIPANAYLILGNLVGGGLDSTRFGLVHRDDILAKAEPL